MEGLPVDGVRTDTKRSRKPRGLLNVKSLGKINHVLDISDADINACMTSMNAVSGHDTINIPKSFAELRRCEQRKRWRVARQAEKEALAKQGV